MSPWDRCLLQQPHEHFDVEARLHHALDLYHKKKVKHILLTGGVGHGDSVSEAQAGKNFLTGLGVDRNKILIEEKSTTTYENLVYAKEVLDKRKNLKTIIFVSDPYHLMRINTMAESLGIEGVPSATPYTRYRSFGKKFPFLMREVMYLHAFVLFG